MIDRREHRRWRVLPVAALPLLLGGCVAALVPVIAAGGMAGQALRTRAEIVAELPAANAAALAAVPDNRAVRLTELTELPPPSRAPEPEAAPWQDFVRFALDRASRIATAEGPTSALLTRESAVNLQGESRPCPQREPAVVIDLDPGEALFVPSSLPQPVPGAAEAIAQLRSAGVIVLWVSQASANEVTAVAAALQDSGLDAGGRDPILLVRNRDERKQVLREEANDTVCVVAIAGDRRGDFDELFDYLRDDRVATAFDGRIGDGWFLVPPPLSGEATGTVPSGIAPAGEDGGG